MTETIEQGILDIEKLIKPISDENPVGDYLRYEGLYDQIEEMRKEDDPNLPQGVWQTDLKSADWTGVFEASEKALSAESKDLQIASWLMESMIYLHGLNGVAEGLRLIYELCREFWDDVYPALEEDDVEFRISPFLWINSVLAEKLKIIPIIKPELEDCLVFNFQEWERMVHLEALAKQSASARKSLDGEKKCTRGEYNRSSENTPLEFLQDQQKALQSSLTITNDLCAFLDDHCGKASPSLGQFRKNLEAIEAQMNLLISKRDKSSNNNMLEETAKEGDGAAKTLRFDSGSQIRNRDEAYHLLSEIAEYLMETDPHSPVPFLVKRAVSWGSMSLSELLTELLKDGQNLQQIYSLLGIQE